MFSAIWPSAPKRTNTPRPPHPPPKLTTTITAPTATNTAAPPPPLPENPLHPSGVHDAPWEHIRHGWSPTSPSLSGEGDDDTTFERLGYSQVMEDDGGAGEHHPRGLSPPPLPPPPPPPASSSPPTARTGKEETDRSRSRQQHPETLRKPESGRERWERKAMDVRSTTPHRPEREKEKEVVAARSRRERDREKEREHSAATVAMMDALREENEKLKSMLKQQVQQLDAVREEMKQGHSQMQSEAEKLKGHLNAASEAHEREVETLRMGLQEHVQRLEYLTADRERVRKDKESIKGNLTTEVERLKLAHARETEQFKTTLEEVNLDRTMAHSELRKVKKSLDAHTPKLDESLREIETLRRELSSMKDSSYMVAELKQRLDIQSRELHSAREESSALKKEFNQLATLLRDRSSEIKGVPNTLAKADAFSGTEVTSTLQRLNAEMLQTTAFMAESMVELFFQETTIRVSKTNEQLAACKRASGVIGAVIVHFLGTKKHKDDPILVQIAFQACLTYHLRGIARAWIIGGDENRNHFIDEIYQSVHEKEAQAVAGHWRALTHAHVLPTPFDNSQIALQMANKIIPSLSDILLTTGCTVPKSDIASVLSSKFADRLSFLVSLAMRVNKVVGEDITSDDLEVIAVPPATAFDVMTMEDSYDDGKPAKGRGSNVPKVLCATDLGLRKRTRAERRTGEKQWETEVLLKPKVALESVIDILDE